MWLNIFAFFIFAIQWQWCAKLNNFANFAFAIVVKEEHHTDLFSGSVDGTPSKINLYMLKNEHKTFHTLDQRVTIMSKNEGFLPNYNGR